MGLEWSVYLGQAQNGYHRKGSDRLGFARISRTGMVTYLILKGGARYAGELIGKASSRAELKGKSCNGREGLHILILIGAA